MHFKKKALSSIMSVSLLVLMSVLSIVMLYNWFSTSNLEFFNNPLEKNSLDSIDIMQIENDVIYIKNSNSRNISFSNIKINSNSCGVAGVLVNEINNNLSLKNCTLNIPVGPVEVMLITQDNIYSENVFIRDEFSLSNCTLDGVTVSHLGSYFFYNSSILPYTGNCSLNKLNRSCFDGIYSGNSSYQYASCSLAGQDITPDTFNFINQTGVNLSVIITSDTLIPTGYDGTISVLITGDGNPQFSVAGGSWTNSSTIALGQNLTIRLNSSSSQGTTSIVTLTTGNYSVNWSVRTVYPLYVEYLVVAGGGGGGGGSTAGGGGGGGFRTGVGFSVQVGVPIEVIVGLGGAGGDKDTGMGITGSKGGNSSFSSIISVGGGGGGKDQEAGISGGSGGGAGGSGGIDSNGGNASPTGQGNAGGHNDWTNAAPYASGGGGGAGSVGQNAPSNSVCGNGGDGLNSSISGILTAYAGGGGGGNGYGASKGTGGIGGGGNGSVLAAGVSATPNTGGGGGGSGGTPGTGANGGNGGSGIVIIKYVGSQCATGGIVNTSNGNTTHTFTTSGNFTVNGNCTIVERDITPDTFNFTNQTGVNLNTIITSNTLTPTGYWDTINISIIGNGTPEISVAGGSWTNSTNISIGQNLTIRLNSSSNMNTTSVATLIIGNYSVNWSVETGSPLDVEYLVVAGGGGGGGGTTSGGGGGGGFRTATGFSVPSGMPIEVIVGLGGSGGGAGGGSGVIGGNGGNSSFYTIVSVGGGGGAPDQGMGAAGGSGGGAGGSGGIDSNGGNASPTGQGNAGGHNDWTNAAPYASGGGGGAGSVGQNAPSNSVCGNGGDGLNSSISGILTAYSGGGGGGNSYGATRGLGGIGGGGNGSTAGTGGSGIANTGGGGGGGASGGGASGGNGGSGIVIIKYVGSQHATGGTINTSNGNTTHIFTTSGNFTVY